jgi:hypothetical protein
MIVVIAGVFGLVLGYRGAEAAFCVHLAVCVFSKFVRFQ